MMNSISSVDQVGYDCSCSELSRRVAIERYRIIETLIKRPRRLLVCVRERNSRVKTIDLLAKQNRLSRRTIYRWLRDWNRGGLPALMLKIRSDKGQTATAIK